jgi:hypothetical protein
MSRQLFGLWGIDLDETAFAQALAGAAVDVVHMDDGIAELVIEIPPEMSAADGRAVWASRAVGWDRVTRIEVLAFPDLLDILWLNATLARVAHSVYFRVDEPNVSVAWEWPLRIGLLAGDRSEELMRSLDNSSLSKLVRFVTLGDSVRECELLLIPSNLRAAAERVLAMPVRLTADCVIVMGGAKVESDRIASLTQILRTEVRTGGVALASVPKESRAVWLHSLVANLAHNTTIDLTLRMAATDAHADPPLLVCSRKLAGLARLSHFVERLGAAMKRSSEPATPVAVGRNPEIHLGVQEGESLESMGAKIERAAESYGYAFERDQAAAVVELRQNVELANAEELSIPRMTLPAPPLLRMHTESTGESPNRPFEVLVRAITLPRFVRADFYEERDTSRPVEIIESRHPYFLRIRIAPSGGAGATANVAFDELQLPPSESGHELTIALFELPDGDHAPSSPPAQMKVHLPPNRQSSSTTAWFPTITPTSGAFVARIVVLHQTRVMQTLILRAAIGASQSRMTVTQENVVQPTFEMLGNRRAFDAAFVVNKTGGKPAVMAMTPTSVAFADAEDLTEATKAIAAAIEELTKLADTADITIDDEDVVAVLIKLANHGRLLSRWISGKLPPEIASSDRVQIIEAHLGAFLPLEFVYPSFAPENTAKICPHGKAELADPKKKKCPNERDRNFVCPAAFWGFNRVIERFAHTELEQGRDFQLSMPRPNRTKIEPFQSALIGASKRVNPNDVTGLVTAVKPLVTKVFSATTWAQWTDRIGASSPSMLLLFPHSEEVDGIPALEIGGDFLKNSFLEAELVRRADRDPGPLVLLLGCSTNLPRVKFHGFVAGFRDFGASIVVGTLSLIRGRHATRFVNEFLGALSKRTGTPDAVFGDVLLDTKRKMLAAGDPFALTLVAYGDADWRL